jgi:hypothetical protein
VLEDTGVSHLDSLAKKPRAFLRNSCTRGGLAKFIAELLRPSAESPQNALAILLFIIRGARILIGHVVPQRVVKKYR